MDCEHFHDLILTDYADNCMSPADTTALDQHSVVCKACRLLMQDVRASTIEPFVSCPKEDMPSVLTNRILNHTVYAAAPQSEHPLQWLSRLWQGITEPAPVLARLSAAMVCCLVVFVIWRQPWSGSSSATKTSSQETLIYLAEAAELGIGTSTYTDDNYGTGLESYFLDNKG